MRITSGIVLLSLSFLCGCVCFDRAGADWQNDCKNARQITVKALTSGIVVSPANICADPGSSVSIRIDRRVDELNTVHTKPKKDVNRKNDINRDGDDGWLDQSNNKVADRITFPVPTMEALSRTCRPTEANTCRFYYEIRIDGLGTIDPMITVRRF